MRFYKEIIGAEDPHPAQHYHYHAWTPESTSRFWKIFATNPVLRRQFFPMRYWQDLLAWSRKWQASEPAAVVDIGCGGGDMLASVRDAFPGARLTGMDLSTGSLEAARQRFPADSPVEFQVGCLPELPFRDEAFDLAICTEVLEHLEMGTFARAFPEIRRILKPGGHFLFTLPLNEALTAAPCPECGTVFTSNQHQVYEISEEDIRKCLDGAGMRLVASYLPISPVMPKAWHRALAKRLIVSLFPKLAARLFRHAGVTGFLAQRPA